MLPVLVVEDREDNREFLVDALSECPLLSVAVADSAAQAIRAADCVAHAEPCAVLLDLYLPELDDGLSVLRHYARRAPVIAMTGYASAGEAGDVMLMGARRVLEKPLDRLAVTKCLCEWAVRHLFLREATGSAFLVDSVTCLHDRQPSTVTQWAMELGPRANYLQRQWQQRGRCPKDVLFMHTLLRALTDFYSSPPDNRPALVPALKLALRRYAEREREARLNMRVV